MMLESTLPPLPTPTPLALMGIRLGLRGPVRHHYLNQAGQQPAQVLAPRRLQTKATRLNGTTSGWTILESARTVTYLMLWIML